MSDPDIDGASVPDGLGESAEHPHELRLDLPAVHSASRMGRQVLRKFAEREGLSTGEVETLEFVASELLSNAVDHGGGEAAMEITDLDQDVRMGIQLDVREDVWELRVSDQGGGDPDDVAPMLAIDTMPDLDDDRGRGLFLMTQMVDTLSVEKSQDGRGLVFVAVKRHGRGG